MLLDEEEISDDEEMDEMLKLIDMENTEPNYDAFPVSPSKMKTKNEDSGQAGYSVSIPPRCPDDEIRKMMKLLNKEQRQFVYTVRASFDKSSEERLKVFMTGTAGKSDFFKICQIN